MAIDRSKKSSALTYLFLAFDRRPSEERLEVWSDLVRNVGVSTVWATVDKLCKDPNVRSLPLPGVFYAAMRGRAVPVAQEPRPTANHLRGGQVDFVAMAGGETSEDGDETDIVRCEWVDGCKESPFPNQPGMFEAERWYVRQIRAGRNPSPVLCLVHSGEHLALVGRRKQQEADWAWPVLVRITTQSYCPTTNEVSRMDAMGFALERCSRMAKAGVLSTRERR